MEGRGERLSGVRLDSGDMATLAKEVRQILDATGLGYVQIFASGGLDEDEVDRLLTAGAPIDAFGVGTRMNVSADAPYLDIAYKIVQYAGRDVLKLSEGKTTWAGEKQVYRSRGSDGRFADDLLALRDEPPPPNGEPLLRTVMEDGRIVDPLPTLATIRSRCAAEVAALPHDVRTLSHPARYLVRYSDALMEHQGALEAAVRATEITRG
jgi:nicotinate phosphoribosyltransferase